MRIYAKWEDSYGLTVYRFKDDYHNPNYLYEIPDEIYEAYKDALIAFENAEQDIMQFMQEKKYE